ncbi:hypothetical protein R1flu_005228 [Riccia fluitans]|uniref:Uncharacterized protein n=1 Tax=Riccia fluitans TaxID=41844 RepID=A0ABD1YTI7_9MARC
MFHSFNLREVQKADEELSDVLTKINIELREVQIELKISQREQARSQILLSSRATKNMEEVMSVGPVVRFFSMNVFKDRNEIGGLFVR